jgi:hypothetical protein
MEKRNSTIQNNPKATPKRRGGQILLRQELWKIISEHNEKKLINAFKTIYSHYPIRLSDLFIIFGICGMYALFIAVWKNYQEEVFRTTKPYNLKLEYWGFFPYVYQRQSKEPMFSPPQISDARDYELYSNYEQNKNDLLFKKKQQWEINIRSELENVVPLLDHREIDSTEFQNIIKMNYDIASLTLFKKNINKECVEKGIYSDDKLYMKEKITSDYKISEYMYKDDLYKELLELIKI